MSANPIDGFTIDPTELQYIGHDLQRPECILAEPDGTLWAADARGGVMRIDPDGTQQLICQNYQDQFAETADEATRYQTGTLPNGLAFAENGDILVSNFGTDCLELLTRTGETRILHDSIDGQPIGKVNFVLRDSKNRVWLTVSTMINPWMSAYSPKIADGRVVLVDESGIRVVADGFRFTNEIRLDANEEYLYVSETTGPRISRLKVAADGSLSDREIYGPETLPCYPDGIAFDSYGNLWGTLVFSDKVFVITPDRELKTLLDDGNPAASAAMEEAFWSDRVTPDHFIATGGTIAPWTASITFGGPDLKTVYVGSLKGTRIPYFRSPVAGLPMVHW
jgi:gluconolactonase